MIAQVTIATPTAANTIQSRESHLLVKNFGFSWYTLYEWVKTAVDREIIDEFGNPVETGGESIDNIQRAVIPVHRRSPTNEANRKKVLPH